MQINNLPKSQITTPKPSLTPDPTANKPVTPKAEEKKPAAVATKPEEKKPVVEKVADKTVDSSKQVSTESKPSETTITDVKPTGDTTAQGEPTFTLKVNGKDVKATQSQIIALAQKAQGAEAAMKQKAELEKLSAQFLDAFDKDAYGLMVQRHGEKKAKEIAISMVKNLIAQEAKDPKDVELEQLRKSQSELKAAQEKQKKEQEAQVRTQQQKQLYGQLLTTIDQELNSTHLPKDKLTLTRVLNFLSAGKKANGQAWTVKDAVQAVEQEDMSHVSYYAKRYVEGKLPSDKFKALFGEETFKKLNKEQIETLKQADKIAKTETKKDASTETPKKSTMSKTKGSDGVSEREWRRQHGGMGGI